MGLKTKGFAAAFAVLAAIVSAAAQTGKDARPNGEAPANKQPWVVECNNRATGDVLVCQMSQTLIAQDSGQRILAAVITRKDAKTLAMTLALPHGLNLPNGIDFWVDEGARTKFPIETADQNGSYATIELGAAQLGALRKGTLANVAVKATGGDELILQLSLVGFSSAVDKL
jgi:invasion protein IalB